MSVLSVGLSGDNDLDNWVPWGHHGVNIYDSSHPEETIGANHDISRVTIIRIEVSAIGYNKPQWLLQCLNGKEGADYKLA